jgi:hypothetical protein
LLLAVPPAVPEAVVVTAAAAATVVAGLFIIIVPIYVMPVPVVYVVVRILASTLLTS